MKTSHPQNHPPDKSTKLFPPYQFSPFSLRRLPFQFRPMSRDYVIENLKPEFHPQIDYTRELNPQQLAAVTAPPGRALVIAAAKGESRGMERRCQADRAV
jgi:hypothetical protein